MRPMQASASRRRGLPQATCAAALGHEEQMEGAAAGRGGSKAGTRVRPNHPLMPAGGGPPAADPHFEGESR